MRKLKRRTTTIVVALITAVGAIGTGVALTGAPAHALGDPLADGHVTILPSQVDSLARLCLQIRPSPPQCLQTPTSSATAGTAEAFAFPDQYADLYFGFLRLNGAFVIGPHAFVGEVGGAPGRVGRGPEDAGKIYPFGIYGSSDTGTELPSRTELTGMCEGMYEGGGLGPVAAVPLRQPAVMHLFCSASIDRFAGVAHDAAPDDFQLDVVFPIVFQDPSFPRTIYRGVFRGVG